MTPRIDTVWIMLTIDFSKEARSMVKEALVKNIIGKAITFQINAIDFTKF